MSHTTHRLKCLPEFFQPLWNSEKTFEVRRDDRGFRAGDHLMLAEWAEAGGYTGREITAEVTYLFSGASTLGSLLLPADVVVMALCEVSRSDAQPEARP